LVYERKILGTSFLFLIIMFAFFSDGDIQEEKEWEGPFLP